MSIYTSLTLSRSKALEIIQKKLASATNDDLKDLADTILRKGRRNNVYMVVDDDVANDDHEVLED